MLIRSAQPAEADALSALAGRLFRETYAGRVPEADIAQHVASALHPAAILGALAGEGRTTLVAGDEDGLAAYAQLRLQPPPVPLPFEAPVEVMRFYVEASHHGTGLAARLMAACLDWARPWGGAWLQVWEENPRAIRFYARQGFADAGETTYDVGRMRYRDRVMTRTLQA